jgi:hypothetical protein
VLDLYNKNFNKTPPVKTEILLHASVEVVHPQELEPFAVTKVIDPQEAT